MLNDLIEIIVHTDDALLALVAENILLAYSVLFLIIMLETGLIVFPFLPGDGLLFSAGVVAASTDLNVWILLIALMIAATIGNIVNYYVGKLLGERFKQSNNYFVKNYLIKHLPKAQEFYDKHGERAIIFGRFLPIVRTYIPFLAGVVSMEKQLFIKNTIFGAVAWISIFLLLGFFVGEIPWVKNNYGLIFIGLIIITLLPLVFSVFKKIKN
ncbi:VTT domain-containing protein [Confluentibacter lentus]|uniref:VTT domain-containing protein n=1 Tax=Confluentibacter lentus TaxID=1699412 RepID=UPI000C28F257|nr:VTT domain-containing protein [Confluentibacter lentus]